MRVISAICVLALFSACNVNYDKTKSGVAYKVFSKNDKAPKLKVGEYAKFNIEFTIPEKDTLLNSTYGKLPGYTPIDTSARSQHSFMEVFTKCAVGDSGIAILSVDTLVKRGMIPQYDKTFGKGDRIMCKFRILSSFKNEEEINADYQKELELERGRQAKASEQEAKDLEKYLAGKGIKTQKTKGGTFVEIQSAGDTSLKAEPGKKVAIMYRGYLKSNNEVFDTNMDSSKGHPDPYPLVVGTGSVIPGWDEGLPYFGKGGKGRLYIPSNMAYGPQGRPGSIPPNSTLIFDIEVRDVQDAPDQAGHPMLQKLKREQEQQQGN